MSNENQDLLDLCRINLIEEHLEESVAPESEVETMRLAIDFKKRHLAMKIIANAPKVSGDVMDAHIEENTLDGVYPWTEAYEVLDE